MTLPSRRHKHTHVVNGRSNSCPANTTTAPLSSYDGESTTMDSLVLVGDACAEATPRRSATLPDMNTLPPFLVRRDTAIVGHPSSKQYGFTRTPPTTTLQEYKALNTRKRRVPRTPLIRIYPYCQSYSTLEFAEIRRQEKQGSRWVYSKCICGSGHTRPSGNDTRGSGRHQGEHSQHIYF